MTTAGDLRVAAASLDRLADDARSTAHTLDLQHVALEDRLRPVIQRHTSAVWQSRAAEASRMNLMRAGTGELGRAREDLLTLIGSLRTRADELEREADDHRRRAVALEAAAAAAAAEAAAATVPTTVPSPPPVVSAPAGAQWGIR